MMKRMLLAAAAVATLATMSFTVAPAEARVVIYGGVPYHSYAVAPHWRSTALMRSISSALPVE